MSHLISHIDEVTPAWLSGILHREQVIAESVDVAEIKPASPMEGVASIIPLVASLSDGNQHRFILKLSNEQRNDDVEVRFYETYGKRTEMPIIRCYDAHYENAQFHLLFEDLTQTHYSKPPSMLPNLYHECEYMIEALAKLHAIWWKHPELPAMKIEDVENDMQKLPAFMEFLQERLSPERQAIYEKISQSLLPVYEKRLAQGNFTLIHGDPHPGNFLYPHDRTTHFPRLLDWKSHHVNWGANDIAHMMAVFWFGERRARFEQEFLRFYHQKLQENGVSDYSWDELWYDYRLSIVTLLLYPAWQWTWHTPDFIWWHHMERLMTAYVDLNCTELLD